MPHEPLIISTIAIGLTAAFVGGLLARKLRLPPIVGYAARRRPAPRRRALRERGGRLELLGLPRLEQRAVDRLVLVGHSVG